MSELIGLWTSRYRGEERLTKWHLIESEIGNRHVTRCGRQLGRREGTTLTVVNDSTVDKCQDCAR